jgi:alanyl-tRNA synthetase
MGDIGIIESPHCKIKVLNTMKFLGKVIGHICLLEEGIVSINDVVKMSIDFSYRKHLKMHHTATHILHAVLRDVLGRHVTQKGSLVSHDKLRFDISHPKALTKAEIKLAEQKVNQIISDNSKVLTKLMSTEQAMEAGAMALFGEKYDSEVRVVSLGAFEEDKNPYSFELCGGTHVNRTGDIGAFKILSESAIAAGIRRIEAVCGEFAFKEIAANEELLNELIDIFKSDKPELLQKVGSLLVSKKDLEKQVEKIQISSLMLSDDDINKNSLSIDKGRLFYKIIPENTDGKIARIAAENLSKKYTDLVIVFASKTSEKLSIIIAVSKEISPRHNASEISKHLSVFIGGSGGGQSTLAQIGGTNLAKLQELENEIIKVLS